LCLQTFVHDHGCTLTLSPSQSARKQNGVIMTQTQNANQHAKLSSINCSCKCAYIIVQYTIQHSTVLITFPSFLQIRYCRLGLSHWHPYAMHRGGCLVLYIVTWWSGAGGIQALSERPTGFLQCFDMLVWSYDL